jgi:hypothetical protein
MKLALPDLASTLLRVLPALMAGCAAAPYVQPGGPQTARLTVLNASGEVLPLYTFADAESCTGLLALHPRAGVPRGDAFTVRIAGDAPFTLAAKGSTAPPASFGTGGDAPCSAAATFVPVPGKTYVATYRGTGADCSLVVGERVGQPAKIVPERSLRIREEPACR